MHRMSTGLGVCTCSYFFNDNRFSLYAGTFLNVGANVDVFNGIWLESSVARINKGWDYPLI